MCKKAEKAPQKTVTISLNFQYISWVTLSMKALVRDFLPIPHADPQVAEEAGPPVGTVSLSWSFVSSELFELTQRVREGHVRQVVTFRACSVIGVIQLHQQTGGWAGGSRCAGIPAWTCSEPL